MPTTGRFRPEPASQIDGNDQLLGTAQGQTRNFFVSALTTYFRSIGLGASTIHSGSGEPNGNQSALVGDFYIDTDTTTLYGPKLEATASTDTDGNPTTNTDWTGATAQPLIGPQGSYTVRLFQRAAVEPAQPASGTLIWMPGTGRGTLSGDIQGWSTVVPDGTDQLWEIENFFDPAVSTQLDVWSSVFQAGAEGPPGPTGPAGEMGNQGEPGIQGEMGVPGMDGTDGMDGAPGMDGMDGATGPEGPMGQPGTQGQRGPEGPASTVPGPMGGQGIQGIQGVQGVGIATVTAPTNPPAGQPTNFRITLTDPSGATTTDQIVSVPAGAPGDGILRDRTITINRGGADTGMVDTNGVMTLNLSDHSGMTSHDTPQPDLVITPSRRQTFTGISLTFTVTVTDHNNLFTYNIDTVNRISGTNLTAQTPSGNTVTVTGTQVGVSDFELFMTATHISDGNTTQRRVSTGDIEIEAEVPTTPTFFSGVLEGQTVDPNITTDLTSITRESDFVDGTTVNFNAGASLSYAVIIIPTAQIASTDFTDNTTEWEFTNRSGFAVEFSRDGSDSFIQGSNTVLYFGITQNERLTLINIT